MGRSSFFVLAALVTVAPGALAQDKARAASLFQEATALIGEGRYAGACPKLEESNRLDRSLGTTLWLGGCYEKTDRKAAAWNTFHEAVRLAHEQHDERESVAQEHETQLGAAVFKLTIAVPHPVRGLEVRRDQETVPAAGWGSEVALEAGRHVVSAMAPQYERWEQSLDVPGIPGNEVVTVPELAPIPVAVAPRLATHRDGGWLAAGWTIAIVGIVGGVTLGSAFGIDAKSKLDTSNGPPYNCSGSLCDNQQGVTLRQQALDSANASTVAFIVGGVLLATGITLVLVAPKRSVRVGLGLVMGTF